MLVISGFWTYSLILLSACMTWVFGCSFVVLGFVVCFSLPFVFWFGFVSLQVFSFAGLQVWFGVNTCLFWMGVALIRCFMVGFWVRLWFVMFMILVFCLYFWILGFRAFWFLICLFVVDSGVYFQYGGWFFGLGVFLHLVFSILICWFGHGLSLRIVAVVFFSLFGFVCMVCICSGCALSGLSLFVFVAFPLAIYF